MKKLCVVLILYIFSSCGNPGNDSNMGNTKDTIGNTNPVSIDTLKHPSGMDNSSVISTDTAAMRVQSKPEKADSSKK